MSRLGLALRLLYRDSRSGELTILIFALIIAASSATAISLFADRLQTTITRQAAEFLAADLVITSPTELSPSWLDKAQFLKLQQAKTAEFSSVLIAHDEFLLASIKAVSQHYPLRGYLKTTISDYSAQAMVYVGPEPGTAWVEQRVLSTLKLALNDDLQIGDSKLRVTRIITYEPDKRSNFYSLSPRVMIHSNDLLATGMLQPGSHVHFFFQFAGSALALKQFGLWVKPKLNASQKLMDLDQHRPEIGTALKRAERYLGLSSIVVILIAGVAIAMATRRYTERHFDATAILRCLGCRQSEILFLYSSQMLLVGIAASLCGCILGWLAQKGLFYLLSPLLPATLAEPSPIALLLGFGTGMATLIGFALPPLLRLKKVSPLRVLRRELAPLPSSAWLVYGLAISIVGALIWRFSGDVALAATIIGIGSITILIMSGLIYLILIVGRKLLPKLGLRWRLGLQELVRQPRVSISQILALSITLVAMLLSYSVRNNLLADWQAQLPEKAPNHFALNIFPEQVPALQKDFQDQQIGSSDFYPIIRGRLVRINHIAVQKIVSKESQGQRATHRDLSLTWSVTLPVDNKITAGQWWLDKPGNFVSIEQKLAKSLVVTIGDRLEFTVGSQQLSATVSSIRKVRWDTMKPNFYIIFSPGTLDNFAKTYITSFYLETAQKKLLNQLVKSYPSMTIFTVDSLLKQFKTILTQITQAIDFLMVFALLAGISVLLAAIYASLDDRIYHGALLRTLGANRSLLQSSHVIEFSLLGFIAGLLAVIICAIINFCLYNFVFNMVYSLNWELWIIVPAIASLVIGLIGFWSLRQVVNNSPMLILRRF